MESIYGRSEVDWGKKMLVFRFSIFSVCSVLKREFNQKIYENPFLNTNNFSLLAFVVVVVVTH